MTDERGQKPGRLAELLVEHFERILGPDVQIKSPERICGRHSGRRREVDVTLRCEVGATDVLVAIECRDRKGAQDVRWIEELASKAEDVGANVIVAVSTSGFTEAAKRSAAAHRVLLRDLKQISVEDVDRWLVRTKLSVPRARFFGAVVHTRDTEAAELIIHPENQENAPVFMIPPAREPHPLKALFEPGLEQLLASPATLAALPHDGTQRAAFLTVTPETDDATVITAEGTYPLVKVDIGISFWMEAQTSTLLDARQYADEKGVFAQMASWFTPFPGGFWTLEVTESPPEGERYIFVHKDVPDDDNSNSSTEP
jgi:hypothetical protein